MLLPALPSLMGSISDIRSDFRDIQPGEGLVDESADILGDLVCEVEAFNILGGLFLDGGDGLSLRLLEILGDVDALVLLVVGLVHIAAAVRHSRKEVVLIVENDQDVPVVFEVFDLVGLLLLEAREEIGQSRIEVDMIEPHGLPDMVALEGRRL